MRKTSILLIFYLVFVSFSCYAQKDSVKEKEIWRIGLKLNTVENFFSDVNLYLEFDEFYLTHSDKENKSYSASMMLSYFSPSALHFRIQGGITNINIKEYQDSRNFSSSVFYSIKDAMLKQNRYHFILGIGTNVYSNVKANIHIGFETPLIIYNPLIINASESIYDSAFSNTVPTLQYIQQTTIPGGFSIGCGAFLEFNLKIYKNLSANAEFSFAILYSNLGGEIKSELETVLPLHEHIISTNYARAKNYFTPRDRMSLGVSYIIN